MSENNASMSGIDCDGCLWNTSLPGRITTPELFSVSCFHTYCMQCVREGLHTSKKDGLSSQWFRCPVMSCGIMIQSSQLKDMSTVMKETSCPVFQYLQKSLNLQKPINAIKRITKFNYDNFSGYIGLLEGELQKRDRLIKTLEKKTEQSIKLYEELKKTYLHLVNKKKEPDGFFHNRSSDGSVALVGRSSPSKNHWQTRNDFFEKMSTGAHEQTLLF